MWLQSTKIFILKQPEVPEYKTETKKSIDFKENIWFLTIKAIRL